MCAPGFSLQAVWRENLPELRQGPADFPTTRAAHSFLPCADMDIGVLIFRKSAINGTPNAQHAAISFTFWLAVACAEMHCSAQLKMGELKKVPESTR